MNKGGRPRIGDEVRSKAIALRLPPALVEQIRAASAANGRSITQEVCSRIERTFTEDHVVALVADVIAMKERL